LNAAEYAAMYRVEDTMWWYTGMRRISEAVLGERLRPGLTILDAGCGTGGNLAWLSRFGPAYGIDLSPLAMALASRRRLPGLARSSVLRLPFPAARFDLVTSYDVIYHLDVSDDVAALREMRRVLRPGGVLLVRVPALERLRSGHDAAVHTRQRYSLRELRGKLERAGFTVERATYANSALFPLAAAARLLARTRRGEGDGRHESDVKPAPVLLNLALGAVMRAEAVALRALDLPVGLSAVAVGRRVEPAAAALVEPATLTGVVRGG
jgi:SAM-dependent methyltransferase